MATISLGGEDYNIPELNFMALERAWPFVEIAMVTSGADPMEGPNAALRIIAAGIMEDENFQPDRYKVTAGPDEPEKRYDQVFDFFRKKLKAREMQKLQGCIDLILVEAGLTGDVEEEVGNVQMPSPSTETVVDTSQSSLPQDAKAEAG